MQKDRSFNRGYLVIAGVALVVMALGIFGGCSSPLSAASFAVQQEFHGAITEFGLVAQDFAAKATIMADKKHAVQRRLQALEMANIYAREADEDGNLVLTPTDFAELTTAILDGQHALVTSEARWTTVLDKFLETTRLLGTINTTTMDTAKVIHEVEASIQAFTTQVTRVIGGIVAASAFAL